MTLKNWLAHPVTRGLNIDDPAMPHLRKRIIDEKHFLKQIYKEWYCMIARALPSGSDPVLELGSGGGFAGDLVPHLITSEVLLSPDVDIVLNGQELPFADNSLRGIIMTNVLHHLPEVRSFFSESSRCVRKGGVLTMVEPWVTSWSRVVYSRLHHEPISASAMRWEFPSSGPLSGANSALAWIVFQRDRRQFEQEFPEWDIVSIKPFMPFRYLVSGGVSLRNLMPGWTFCSWRLLERLLTPWMEDLAMFVLIILKHLDEVHKGTKSQHDFRRVG